MLPAVRDASDVVSTLSTSPLAAMSCAVLVDDEDDLGIRVLHQAVYDRSGSD